MTLTLDKPKVLTPPLVAVRATANARLIAAVVAVACLALFAAAAYLTPDPAGVGTTTRLGLEPCNFLKTTGIPCAGCGLTTAFNHAVRWQFASAFYVQPLGAVLALLVPIAFWIAAAVAVTGRPIHKLVTRAIGGRGVNVIVASVGFGIFAWGWKIVTTLA